MKYTRLFKLFCLLMSVCAFVTIGTAADDVAKHRFQSDALPIPPRQTSPWTPPKTRLSSRRAFATRTLFAQGLADPRGCEYREFQRDEARWYFESGAENAEKPVHGWVLPTDPRWPQRFTIGWDGLIYPIAKIGPKTDLRADVLQGSSDHGVSLLSLALLLRLGEGELAEITFKSIEGTEKGLESVQGSANATYRDDLCDPFLPMAKEWTTSLYDRAMKAHRCGDDRMALLTARQLVPLMDAVEAEADRLDPSESHLFCDPQMGQPPPKPHLEELQPVRAILVDQERRAVERKKKTADTLSLEDIGVTRDSNEGPPDDSMPAESETAKKARRTAHFWQQVETKLGHKLDSRARVARVIRWFDGEANPYELLRPYRDEAIEPLLDCLVHDSRLARSFGNTTDPSSTTAGGMAYVALDSLLETDFQQTFPHSFDELSEEGRKALAEKIRAHWKEMRKMRPATTWP